MFDPDAKKASFGPDQYNCYKIQYCNFCLPSKQISIFISQFLFYIFGDKDTSGKYFKATKLINAL